jgi:uncharacterized protein YuzE
MEKEVKVWYDQEGDYLEVLFDVKKGYFKETSSEEMLEKVDESGKVIGFSILNFSNIKKGKSLSVLLK